MNIQIDSNKVQKGDIFFCIKGTNLDGHDFVHEAVNRGASIVVYEEDIPMPLTDGTAYIKVESTLEALSEASDSFYGFPSKKLTMFGVTGTNGKTSIAYIIADAYSKLLSPCGYVGTIGGYISTPDGKEEISPIGLTTPNAIEIHEILQRIVQSGATACTLEVSAQGLDQHRVSSVDFDFAIYTNLTQEHLDYFGDMENYFRSKALLFQSLKHTATAIINIDDSYGSRIIDATKESDCERIFTYGLNDDADYRAIDIKYTNSGIDFILEYDGNRTEFSTNIHVTYNLYNLLASIATLHQSGIPIESMVPLFKDTPTVPGRMINIDCGQDFKVIVDFAHTSDSYSQILKYVREDLPETNRIITVNGAAGGRDTRNRKEFARWIGEYGDYAIFTEDDPRDESVEKISLEMASYLPEGFPHSIIPDRYEAIEYAIKNAKHNDVILILGKGIEKYQARATGKEYWMGDDEAAREILGTL